MNGAELPFYTLHSALSRAEVLERLLTLGPSSEQATSHLKATALELAPEPGLLAPVLDVLVEERASGSFVTVRIVPSAFLREFVHVVRVALCVLAAIAAGYVGSTLRGLLLAQWLFGIALLLTALLALIAAGLRAIVQPGRVDPHYARLRHQLGKAIHS